MLMRQRTKKQRTKKQRTKKQGVLKGTARPLIGRNCSAILEFPCCNAAQWP